MTWLAARAALDSRMASLPGLQTGSVVWDGEQRDQPQGFVPWYRIDFIPATNEPELQGANHERGIYQVTVCATSGEGLGALLGYVDALIAHFARVNVSGVSCGVPTPGPILREPEWLRQPVSIPFTVL